MNEFKRMKFETRNAM